MKSRRVEERKNNQGRISGVRGIPRVSDLAATHPPSMGILDFALSHTEYSLTGTSTVDPLSH
jgi:hypothetical protein